MSPDRRRGRADSTARSGEGTAVHRGASVQAPLVLDRYALHKRLGAGAFGTVWMARDERLERDVAVKILARELIADGRFEREARAAARLSHPGIVTLYEAAVDDEGAYLVSELVRGETLSALLEDGALSDRDIVEIGVALCDALAHAHEQGVVHRDVKPSNVLIPRTGRSARTPCKLTDFGVARIIDSDSLTLTGDVIGTLNYMAPEQSAGLEAGEAADLYSLALVLYEALTGVNPLRSPGTRGSRRLLQLPSLRRQRRDLPVPMAQAIDRALRPRIEERGTLAELRDGLAGGVEHVGEEPGVVTGPFERMIPEEDDEVTRRFGLGTLIAPRDGGLAAPVAARRTSVPPEDLTEPDASRLIWQARAVAGACAAGSAAWLDHRLLAPHGMLSAPVALAALVAGGLSLVLPRVGWIALTLYICVATAIQGAAGISVLVALVALIPVLLLPASGTLWAVSAVAPALGVVGLAGAWPALAGWAHRPWRRMMLGATGWLWLALAGPLMGRALYEPRPRATAPPAAWRGSISHVVEHVLIPFVHSGQLAGAVVWGAGAILVPWIVMRRNPLLDVVRALLWSAALVIATPAAVAALGRVVHAPPSAAAPSALAGALAAAALALAPLAITQARRAIRQERRVP
ncbi:MAG TPA: serine/threonine-protein kinase [Solirubrobacteraceae bacterium]|nr:serine/threonine-protein kinase [Solirubrobacteraceae bacterium]